MSWPPERIEIDGQGLGIDEVVAVARDNVPVELTDAGREQAHRSHQVMTTIASQRPVYGQSTGVGANKESEVIQAEAADHGVRLLRSHAAGAGPEMSAEHARAMMVVRLNQLAAGGSGVNPELLGTLESALNNGLTPNVKRYGAIGTGDLTALSVMALHIMGERPWQGGTMQPYAMGNTEALAFISSSAATLGEAAIASHDMDQRLRASITVAALSFLALQGSAEAYDPIVHELWHHPGQIEIAADMRELLGQDMRRQSRHIQDSYGLRAFPQAHGPALEAAERLKGVLKTDINAASENPLVGRHEWNIFHNGNFHLARAGLALDGLRAAVYGTASLSVARLKAMMEPANTGLRPFLAEGPEGSSGLLINEYVAHSALAELRHLAAPDSLGGAVLSRGAEEHAGFATQSSWHTAASIPAYETILACELMAAVRILREQSVRPSEARLRGAFELAASVLDPDQTDHPLDGDIAAATDCVRAFASLPREVWTDGAGNAE